MDRRAFLAGLVTTAAGLLVPDGLLVEPRRRLWPGWRATSVPVSLVSWEVPLYRRSKRFIKPSTDGLLIDLGDSEPRGILHISDELIRVDTPKWREYVRFARDRLIRHPDACDCDRPASLVHEVCDAVEDDGR
jgi:hypothetical protein